MFFSPCVLQGFPWLDFISVPGVSGVLIVSFGPAPAREVHERYQSGQVNVKFFLWRKPRNVTIIWLAAAGA